MDPKLPRRAILKAILYILYHRTKMRNNFKHGRRKLRCNLIRVCRHALLSANATQRECIRKLSSATLTYCTATRIATLGRLMLSECTVATLKINAHCYIHACSNRAPTMPILVPLHNCFYLLQFLLPLPSTFKAFIVSDCSPLTLISPCFTSLPPPPPPLLFLR